MVTVYLDRIPVGIYIISISSFYSCVAQAPNEIFLARYENNDYRNCYNDRGSHYTRILNIIRILK